MCQNGVEPLFHFDGNSSVVRLYVCRWLDHVSYFCSFLFDITPTQIDVIDTWGTCEFNETPTAGGDDDGEGGVMATAFSTVCTLEAELLW